MSSERVLPSLLLCYSSIGVRVPSNEDQGSRETDVCGGLYMVWFDPCEQLQRHHSYGCDHTNVDAQLSSIFGRGSLG